MLKNIKVIFQDQYLLVIDKSPGQLVIPTPKEETNTLTAILNREFTQSKNSAKIYPCHRLDRETSGVIIFAKGKSTQQKVMQQFHRQEVKKTYLAFVQGRLKYSKGIIEFPIKARCAITEYKCTKFDERGFSVVEIKTLTGRTNQIRIHFKMIGHPLLGERRFAFAKDYKLKFRRAALHANMIQFRHPYSNNLLEFQAPLAEDMKLFLEE